MVFCVEDFKTTSQNPLKTILKIKCEDGVGGLNGTQFSDSALSLE